MSIAEDKELFAAAAALLALPDTVTGYCVMANGAYGGEYTFPRNKDKVEIHWPPNVVPDAPPTVADGEEAYWNGTAWGIRPFAIPHSEPFVVERLRLTDVNGIPLPETPPVQDEFGQWPYHVLNEDGTEWVWQYPPAPTEIPE